jgi:predicted enzyme related to lactoylglutathione lyase
VTKATALGAKVLIPPQNLPGGDELAILHDPEGIPLGIFRPSK